MSNKNDKIYEVTPVKTSKYTPWRKLIKMSEFVDSIIYIRYTWISALYVKNSIESESGRKRRGCNYLNFHEMSKVQCKQLSDILDLGFVFYSSSEYSANPELCNEIFREKVKQFNARPKIYSDTKRKIKIKT